MQFQLEEKLSNDPVEMRSVFCHTLMELAGQNRDIMVLDADLMGAMGTKPFAKAFPEQTVDCGIQEANMMGVQNPVRAYVCAVRNTPRVRPDLCIRRLRKAQCQDRRLGPRHHGGAQRRHAYAV